MLLPVLERPRDLEIREPRAIVNRKGLQSKLQDLLETSSPASDQRAAVLELLKSAFSSGQAEVRRRFDAGATGTEVVRSLCYLADQMVRIVHDHVTQQLYPSANPSTGELLSLVALGGYGRGELAPQSDIDLLFLLPYKMTPRSEQVVEGMLYLLWDIGYKVGHATRSVDDCIRLSKGDTVISTSLLEARWLWGDQSLYLELRRRYDKEIRNAGRKGRAGTKFIEAKLAERDKRHKKMGDTRYSLEPNIKDGKGGLRDLHTLYWIAKFLYNVDDITALVEKGVFTRAEVKRFQKAQSYLWILRCHLHYLTGRPEERLTFDMQMEIAPRLGYTAHAGSRDVERFMKHYFLVAKDVGDLTRIFCAALEAEHDRRSRFRLPLLAGRRRLSGFRLEGDRLTVKDPRVFAEKPTEMLRIFKVAQEHDLDIHPQVLRWITQNLKHIDKDMREDPAANEVFLSILTSPKDPETALRRLNEADVFGRFVPEFGRVVAQMQYNMYHHFTVDEHTIFALGILHDIEQGKLSEIAPIATEVVHKVLSRRVLYLAVLLHDIAKGRPGDHSEVGARVAEKLCPRMGLTAAETETVAWLVLHHLAMSHTAFQRDIDDPQTIQDFAELVQSPERLRLLLVLTVADIRAVGPNVWNAWKASLLRELYWRTEEVLTGGLTTQKRDQRVTNAKENLAAALTGWSSKDIKAHLRRGHPAYWMAFDAETLQRHGELVREAEAQRRALTVDTRVDIYRDATEVTVYTADVPGLFSRIAGALAVAGATIEAARIFTLTNGMALDSFYIHDAAGGPFQQSAKLARLSAAIEKALSGKLNILEELAKRRSQIPSRLRVFKVSPRVLIDNNASRDHTVIEVNGRDRPGLLYQVTLALTKMRLTIKSARIATYGERVVDVFYVQDAKGQKIESIRRCATIEKNLLAALANPDCRPEKPAPKPRSRKSPAKPAKAKPKKATRKSKPPKAAAE